MKIANFVVPQICTEGSYDPGEGEALMFVIKTNQRYAHFNLGPLTECPSSRFILPILGFSFGDVWTTAVITVVNLNGEPNEGVR